jgi:putative Holliday junction resolvase
MLEPMFEPMLEPISQPLPAATLLAFDYGERRIGVAIGNTLTRHARALTIIANHSREFRFAEIERLIGEWGPNTLVVGLPCHPDGTPHAMTQLAKRFGNQLNGRFGLAVTWVDERYSSVAAAAQGGEFARPGAALDAEAARIILQQYFDERDATTAPGLR